MAANSMITTSLACIAEAAFEEQQRTCLVAYWPANGVANEGDGELVKRGVELRWQPQQYRGRGVIKVELVQGNVLASLLFSTGFTSPQLMQDP